MCFLRDARPVRRGKQGAQNELLNCTMLHIKVRREPRLHREEMKNATSLVYKGATLTEGFHKELDVLLRGERIIRIQMKTKLGDCAYIPYGRRWLLIFASTLGQPSDS